jgi:3-hydroxybutyryl-CoA dehydrogenase
MFKHLGIIGAGTMGTGIARLAILANIDVLVYDVNDTVLRRSFERIRSDVRRMVQQGLLPSERAADALARLHSRTSVSELSSCDFVIESVVEDLRVKKDLFKHLDANTKPTAILATDTASLSVTAIASQARFPERIVGMHFFNPVLTTPLVEVVNAARTDEKTLETTMTFARFLGKTPVVVNDTPGFIVSRVSAPYFQEAVLIAAEHAAEPAQIDRILREIGEMPVGPLQQIDEDGLDVHLGTAESLLDQFYGESRFRPHPLLRRMAEGGMNGKKSGRGFHSYDVKA